PEEVALGREGEEHPLAVVLNEVKRLRGDVWVRLGEAEGTGRQFVDALLDSEPNRLGEGFREELAQNTRGHPLFTVEILRDMEEHHQIYEDERGRWVPSSTITWDALPQRVEGAIERRINRLDPRLRRVLATASVEGEAFTAEVVARVRRVSTEEMVGLLSGELAKRHRLVQAGGVKRRGESRVSRYRFSHNLFQRHLYHSLDPVECAYLHEAVGEALEALYQGTTEEVAGQLACHFQEAGRPGRAITYLRQAGDAAFRAYANAEAIAHYGQAIHLAQRVDVDAEDLTTLYARMGKALELNSAYDEALVTYREMEALARQRDDRAMELASLVAQVTVQAIPTAVYDAEAAVDLGERVLALSRDMDDPAAEAKSLSALAMAQLFANRHAEAIDSGERSLALARELGLREQTVQTLGDLGAIVYLFSGRIPQAIEALEEVSGLYEALGDQEMFADSLSSASTAHVFAGEYDRAIALSERALAITESFGIVWGQSVSQWKVGLVFWERGEVSRAIAVMEASIRLAERVGFVLPQTDTRADLAALYGDLGAVAHGIETARAALSASAELAYPIDRASALAILAYLHALNGDADEAHARIKEAREDPHRDVWPFTFVRAGVAEGRLTLHQRDYERCAAVTDELIAFLPRHEMRIFLSEALWLRGEALLGLGREAAARDALSQARTEAEAIGSRRTLWRILHALSQFEEDRTEAERLHQEARDIVRYIVDHIDQTDLRASYLSFPNVRAVVKAA
ncbi:MAG: tetratricopeptide repeat protein, partial [Anaerolineae bacterium]